MNEKIELKAGVDTVEITTPTYYEGVYPCFTHDTQRITQQDGAEPKYKYRVNPDKTGLKTDTLQGYAAALDVIMEDTQLTNTTKTRIDFRFDSYDKEYTELYKINKLLLLLIAENYNVQNRYQTIDMLSGKGKTLRIQTKYIEVEFYNKIEQEPDGKVLCRLELRSKALYDCNDESGKEQKELKKWISRLKNATTGQTFSTLVNTLNDELIQRYSEERQQRTVTKPIEFITKYADFIFTTRQLTDLFIRMGYDYPEQQTSRYKASHRLKCYSLTEVRNYVSQIARAARTFINEPAKPAVLSAANTAA